MEDWWGANIVPLFKEGCTQKSENYRPVSLASVVGKLVEGILCDIIYQNLERQGLIRYCQHAFVHRRSFPPI